MLFRSEAEAPRYGVDPARLIGRLVYGVGTRLATSQGDAALDGVYKLVALEKQGEWRPSLKLSDSPAKTLNPGRKRAWRLYDQRAKAIADVLALAGEDLNAPGPISLHHPADPLQHRLLERASLSAVEPLLVDVLRQGSLVSRLPSIEEMRVVRQADLDRLDPGVKRLVNPHAYHVSLTRALSELKHSLIEAARDPMPKD